MARERGCEKPGLSLCPFFSFLFLDCCNHAFIVSIYKKPHVVQARKKTKPISQNLRPLHLFMGRIKDPESRGKATHA